MMREIRGPCFSNGVAQVRVITNREEALDNKAFFFQLINLYKHLSDRCPARDLITLVNPNVHFVLITDESNLVASATFALVKTSLCCKGLVEELVVDHGYQKEGIGKALLQEMIRIGEKKGCQFLQLTSRPERPGTACFYPKLGFELIATAIPDHPKGTNLYRYTY